MTTPAEPVFDQAAAGSEIYWLNGGDRRAGFRASATTSFGASITLTESWTDGMGLWFWLDADPGDDAAFATALDTYLGLLPPARGPRTIWIGGAAQGFEDWRSSQLSMVRSGDTTAVVTGTIIELGGIRLVLGAGSTVTVNADAEQGWILKLAGNPALSFVTGEGLFDASQGWAGLAYVPAHVGCVMWTLDLPAPEGDTATGIDQLGASLRFFGPDPVAGDGTVRVLAVQPLRQSQAVTLHCSVDPLAPLDPARTRLGLLPFGATAATVPSFATGYVTARGYGVTLAPRNTASATPPGFVMAIQPLVTGVVDGPFADVPVVYYLTPDGDFDLTPVNTDGQIVTASLDALGRNDLDAAPAERLLCGTTGLDYVGLAQSSGTVMSFRAGRPAYAPPFLSPMLDIVRAMDLDEAAPPALTGLGTTAWSWISGTSAARYYAQPEDAPFYTGGSAGFLNYLEISAATLTTNDPEPCFPMVGYAGLDEAQATFATEIEARGVAPERRRQIGLLTGTQWLPAALRGAPLQLPETTIPAVSPPGLAIGYAGDDVPWAWLAVGNTGTSSDGLPDLRFTAVDGAFRQALLTNRLFMVLGSAATVLANGSVAYQLTPASLGLIQALPPEKGVPADIYTAVANAVRAAGYPVYPTETAFNAMLTGAAPTITTEQMLVFQRFAGLLSPAIGDWLFRLSPRNWAAPDREGPKNARLIFKFVSGRSLADLVADTSGWSWPEASSDDGKAATARDDIQSIIRTARQSVAIAREKKIASPYDRFVEVIDDPYWAGVLALSVEVPLDTLPEPLQPLAAGIDPGGFYAHHLGLTATSFTSEGGRIDFDTTSSFGLIDYQNPIDQYFSSDIAFAFRVQQLTVGFENGKLASFTSSAQLMVNRLFGTETRLFPSEHGNNIILDGVYQSERNDGGSSRDTYVFAMRDAGAFQLALGQLMEVGVDQTRLVTLRAADPASGNTMVSAAFQMTGRLRFAEPANFDPFCWGPPATVEDGGVDALTAAMAAVDEAEADASSLGLAYSNYAITMSFSLSDPTAVTFTVADSNMALDTANSAARENSLFARFPLRLTGLMATPDPAVTGGPPSTRDPDAAGFVSISAPIQQGKLTQPWYGLVYEVELGTLGALAGSVGLTLRLLAAWSPAGGEKGLPAVYFGVALPGVERMLGVSLPLQGILDIGFRTIQFTTYTDAQNRRQYLMRLRDFGLHVLGLSFPPGHNDITLFGNPDQTSNTKLGWYAAYDNGKGKDEGNKAAASTAASLPTPSLAAPSLAAPSLAAPRGAAAARLPRRRLPTDEARQMIRAARPARIAAPTRDEATAGEETSVDDASSDGTAA
ncbi:hemagglutinin protein [Tistrella sp. BH-R2-4]|uniref:Hemagglutinin protein n=1 Tax=Tistrella arctica TaxID=3133430 RepID=A0ABU9YRG8_9PROT